MLLLSIGCFPHLISLNYSNRSRTATWSRVVKYLISTDYLGLNLSSLLANGVTLSKWPQFSHL